MNRFLSVIIIALLTLACSNEENISQEKTTVEYTTFVNPFMGTDGPGNTYPGAQFPFGGVQLSPDHGLSGWDRISGYSYIDTIISGFSHLHLSGTGAGDLYDLLFMPVNDRSNRTMKDNGFRPYSVFSHDEEGANPGYYWVNLKDFGIKAEMTASSRGGVQKYSFPKDAGKAILVDLGYSLNWDGPTDTYIEVVDTKTIVGYRKSAGWAADQRVYFKAEFSESFSSYDLFEEDKKVENKAKAKHTKIKLNFEGEGEKIIEVKVAIASSSIDGASANFDAELKGNNFSQIREKANNDWNTQLSKISAQTSNDSLMKTFYTTLYQTMLNPRTYSDVNGNYKAPNGELANASGYTRYELFSLWDTFRAAHPLYTIMHPERVKEMVRSLIAHYRESGLLPVWTLEGNETNMMMGYHSVPVIVDAYFKGLLNDFDKEELFQACKTSAMQDAQQIDEYKKNGYVASNGEHENWSVSKTLEYAYDDWTIAQLAKDLGKTDDYKYFMKRAGNWENHYDEESTFLRTIEKDGSFVSDFIPKEYTDDYCESNAWQYFWFVPHNIQGLINKVGTAESFEAKLDSMFNYYPTVDDDLPIFSTGMIGQYAHGNEPSHHVGYLYNYIGKPWKTQKIIREIAESQYAPIPSGHCGNEDCGQMSAWFTYTAMGFYPVNPADGIYVLGTPLLDNVKINLEGGKTFEINSKNLSSENIYIQKAMLNGKALEKSYIRHSDITSGGKLEFEMGPNPNKELWTNKEAFPPSNEL